MHLREPYRDQYLFFNLMFSFNALILERFLHDYQKKCVAVSVLKKLRSKSNSFSNKMLLYFYSTEH